MTIAQIKKLHYGKGIAIVAPASTNRKSGFVDQWDFLQLVADLEDVEKVIRYYESKGLVNVVPVPMSDDVEIREALAAKFCRVLFDQNYLARFILFGIDV